MKLPPKEITLCNLEVIVMPNGEVLCLGKTLGWFRELSRFLAVKTVRSKVKNITPKKEHRS